GEPVLDLDYPLDSRADVDMNTVRNSAGQYVEIQGSAEAAAGFGSEHLTQMLELAVAGCDQLMEIQRQHL
ncbi:MAG: ribonuclease PH, partial [Planctomycetota bacterium]